MATTTTKPAQAAEVVNLPAARPRSEPVNAIVPATWQEVTAIAGAICRARMAPKSYCDRNGDPFPDKVAIAIMHGMEVGMTPMASLQSLAVINGMPSLYGDGLVAVVRASGHLEDLQEGLDLDKDGKPLLAWCKVKRKGEASWKDRTLSYPECQRAGWTSKDGPWKLTPGRMMTIRVRGWLLRDMFADVLRGLHSAEEVEDMVDITSQAAATVAPPEPRRADFEEPSKKAAEKPSNEASSPPKPSDSSSGESGQQEPPAAGGTVPTADASGQPAPGSDSETTQNRVTDVVDQNAAPEPITFQTFSTARDFFLFCEEWLQDPKRTPAEAKQWEEFYRDKLAELSKHSFQRIREATAEAIGFYSAVLEREPQQ